MAHTCPECGKYCTCGGDWDDIDFGENINCECPCWMEDNEFDDDPYEDPDYDMEGKNPNDSRNP